MNKSDAAALDFATAFKRVASSGDPEHRPEAGVCLSGGGFRAMLFHVGALRRLHEAGALRHLSRITSVSGGSITAATLALHWHDLLASGRDPEAFVEHVELPLMDFATKRIDARAVTLGVLTPGRTVADFVARAYRPLFGSATLANIPARPWFTILATNLATGTLVRFANEYTADYEVGRREALALPLTTVVAASSAFPPVLSPLVLKLRDNEALTQAFDSDRKPPEFHCEPYTHVLKLGDGGVYDNLGLQPLEDFHTILASDGGLPFTVTERVWRNWLMHMVRNWKVTDKQVRSRRKSRLIEEFTTDRRMGAYWAINSHLEAYREGVKLPAHHDWVEKLSQIKTRLRPIPEPLRQRLVNWGYAACDTMLRVKFFEHLPAGVLPYPNAPIDTAITTA